MDSEVVKIGHLYSGLNSSSWPGGFTGRIAAEVAMERIEQAGVLPEDVEMQLVFIDTSCNGEIGKRKLFPVLEANEVKAFIGPECSEVADDVVAFTAHSFFDQKDIQKPWLIHTSYFYNAIDQNENTVLR